MFLGVTATPAIILALNKESFVLEKFRKLCRYRNCVICLTQLCGMPQFVSEDLNYIPDMLGFTLLQKK
jgi:hypothetical protein